MPLATTRGLNPEHPQLERKRAELTALRATQAERESAVQNLRAEIATFRGIYTSEIGSAYAELSEWRARILELKAQLDPTDEAHAKAKAARSQAQQDREETEQSTRPELDPAEFNPSSPLRKLYREVARRIHPDFCKNVDGLERRTRFMAEANRAYEASDADALQSILDEYDEGAEVQESDSPAAEISRVERQIVRAKAGIAAAEREWDALGKSQLGRFKKDCDVAEQEGRNLMAELAGSVQEQIRRAETEYQVLSRDALLQQRFAAQSSPRENDSAENDRA